MSIVVLYFIIIVLCLLCSSYLSSYETALTWINRHRLKSMAKQRSKQGKKAALVYLLKENFTSSLTIILVWNNIFNIVATTLLNLAFGKIFGAGSIAIATTVAITVSTILIIIFGEIIPKNLAFRHAEKLAVLTVYGMLFFKYLSYPLVYVVMWIEKKKKTPRATEIELMEVLESSEDEGVFEHHEKELVEAAVKMKEKKVGDSMIKWNKVQYLRINSSRKELNQIINNKYHFSRLPVLSQSKDKLVGFVKMKDIYAHLILNNINPVFYKGKSMDLSSLIITPIFIKEEDNLLDVMELLQQKKLHMAVVTRVEIKQNEKINRLVGILTLEDVLEELVGEIYDEHDEIKYNEPVVKTGLDSFLIRGDVGFKIVFQNYLDETNLPIGHYNTFHDWVVSEMRKKGVNKTKMINFTYENLEVQVYRKTKKGIIYKVVEHHAKIPGIVKTENNYS